VKRLTIICLLLAACSPHLITPVPHPPRIAPAVAPPTAVDAPLLPTITPDGG